MAHTVLGLLKLLPRTNCGDCGQATCIAFATQVIKEGEDLARCPHLSEGAQAIDSEVKAQQDQGLGRRRESLAISLEVMHAKMAPLNFAALAAGLGAVFGQENGRPYLIFPYFGRHMTVFKDEVRYPAGQSPNPWDAILLYNYISRRHLDYLSKPAQFRFQDQDPDPPGERAGGPFCRPTFPFKAAGARIGGRRRPGLGECRLSGGLHPAAQGAGVAVVLGRGTRGGVSGPGPLSL